MEIIGLKMIVFFTMGFMTGVAKKKQEWSNAKSLVVLFAGIGSVDLLFFLVTGV